jgi:hypothetical protein
MQISLERNTRSTFRGTAREREAADDAFIRELGSLLDEEEAATRAGRR